MTYFLESLDGSCSERSGKKNKINEAIPGNNIPIKNQILGLRPIRLAKNAVIKGKLNIIASPNEINIAAPIIRKFSTKVSVN